MGSVSATLLRVPGAGSILFDCGEGTLGQLSRLYGPEELPEVLKDIKCIYISHLHADHHLGVAAVLKAWYHVKHYGKPSSAVSRVASPNLDVPMGDADSSISSGPDSFIWVIGLGKYKWLLKEYADVEDFGYSWLRYISTEDIRKGQGKVLQK